MSEKFVYQNARIKSMEQKLLTPQHIQRLFECTTKEEAYKQLVDAGFGVSKNTNINDFDSLFYNEEESAMSILREFNVDHELDAYLVVSDYHNLKALIKLRATEKEDNILLPMGTIDPDYIKSTLYGGRMDDVPSEMREAILQVEKLIQEGKANPRIIDNIVDKAMYKHISRLIKRSEQIVKDYFVSKIDLINIETFVRTKKLNLDERVFEDAFIDGGSLDKSKFTAVFDSSIDAFKEKVQFTKYRDAAFKLLEGGSLVTYEKECDDLLMNLIRSKKDDMFSVAPIINYYLTRLLSIKAAKLVVAGIKNKVDPALLRERMRDIYA